MGAGINLFRQLFPEDYYAYQTATLISSKPVSKVVVGVNQWDEEWEVGGIDDITGNNYVKADRIRSKNYNAVNENDNYYLSMPNYGTWVYCYDENKAYISSRILVYANRTFTLLPNTKYIRLEVFSEYGTTYNNDISINYPSTDHDYHAYEEHTNPLGSDEIRGLLKVENGQLVAYGDIHPSDGNGTEVFDIVDLGSLTFGVNAPDDTYWYLSCTLSDTVDVSNSDTTIRVISDCLLGVSASNRLINNSISIISSHRIFVTVAKADYASVSDFSTAMSGKYLIYEKATPTAKSYTPFTNPMLCGSTEEFTDSRSLKMFCGHDSIYADNISFAHIDFGQTVTDGTLDVVHGILTPTGGSPVSVTPASIKTFSGVNNVFSNGGGDITAIYLDTL